MVKEKYFYYLYLINALINIINFVPRVLIEHRFEGALMSILISVAIGTTLLVTFTKLIGHFPGEGLPELVHGCFPRMLGIPLLTVFALLWYESGAITLVSFVDITLRYISPDVSPLIALIVFLLLVTLSSRLRTESILYALETTIILNVPLVAYMLIKSLVNPHFSWDAVMQVITHLWTAPNYSSIAGATFIFTGYVNLAIFNRAFQSLKPRQLWMIPISGLLILLITLLVPIGYHGTIGVEDQVFTWFSTADSIRSEFFLVERVLFIFYFTYLSLSLVTAVIHWHIALEIVKTFALKKKTKGSKAASNQDWWILAPMVIATIGMGYFFDQERLGIFGQWFLNVRLIGEMLLIATMLVVYLRRKKRA
ncbi:GerAB/ArcD/ProY family transporter [Paenibacillus bouchesdurhonensis]|uniref:GerAB/ArcD/ProY family transporter n=1 Tax=Paenibacillus bouchesdurhonensis TaxID=1870990 RepID=UPI000DA60E16|nr:GerAB/ArcD/ProY family transporter [Paenibacillus bouchesdurhonensis]